MNTQKKSLIIKLIIKILLLCLLVSMSTVLINLSLNTKSTLFYNANGNIDYKVYLKENKRGLLKFRCRRNNSISLWK